MRPVVFQKLNLLIALAVVSVSCRNDIVITSSDLQMSSTGKCTAGVNSLSAQTLPFSESYQLTDIWRQRILLRRTSGLKKPAQEC
jgi:hypothetical protein